MLSKPTALPRVTRHFIYLLVIHLSHLQHRISATFSSLYRVSIWGRFITYLSLLNSGIYVRILDPALYPGQIFGRMYQKPWDYWMKGPRGL